MRDMEYRPGAAGYRSWSGEALSGLEIDRSESDYLDRVRVGFFARLTSRCEEWAPPMLRSALVLKGAGYVDWNTCPETAKAIGRPGAGDRSNYRVCLEEDEPAACELGTATRTRMKGR